ncbi:DUF1801 domain-containing protein [Marivirga arenosa]|uniref:DUF1801 domain-containing protein n=1 Tax=Marivirga arenosa TaxID=3059076 RepID=A0AA51ZWI6_9BACT|nr:DUF1801 domain-containing protein [Marivirga sp. BKB1-2]WNB17966.1 DUF1801 domain-containing protein [Marivirga sp. BKB1-2]
MTEVEQYIFDLKINQREIMLYFHDLLAHQLELEDKIRYKIPFYYHKSWVCYMNPIKNGGVEVAFLRANELSNHQGILDFKGRKQVAGISFSNVDEIPRDHIYEIIQEALLLDESIPYTSKRKK